VSIVIVPVDAYWEKLLADLTSSVTAGNFTGVLSGTKMNLYTTAIGLTNALVYSSMTLPTAPGVVDQTVVWPAAAVRQGVGIFGLNAPLLNFQMTDNTTPGPYYGYFVYIAGTPNILLFAEAFSTNYNLNDTWDYISIGANVQFGGGSFGTATVTAG
jgi:hypothetical protein